MWGGEETQKDNGEEETKKKSCPDNAKSPYRAKQEVVIQTSSKIGQGLNQEGARDGAGERLRLGNELRDIRQASP